MFAFVQFGNANYDTSHSRSGPPTRATTGGPLRGGHEPENNPVRSRTGRVEDATAADGHDGAKQGDHGQSARHTIPPVTAPSG